MIGHLSMLLCIACCLGRCSISGCSQDVDTRPARYVDSSIKYMFGWAITCSSRWVICVQGAKGGSRSQRQHSRGSPGPRPGSGSAEAYSRGAGRGICCSHRGSMSAETKTPGEIWRHLRVHPADRCLTVHITKTDVLASCKGRAIALLHEHTAAGSR